jgi:hypothetical protein
MSHGFVNVAQDAKVRDVTTMARLGRQPPVVRVNKTDNLRVPLQAATTAATPQHPVTQDRSRAISVPSLIALWPVT